MSPYYADGQVTLFHADCLHLLAELDDCSVDAVVTDPPYGLEFMGKDWDAPWQSGKGTGGHNAGFSAGAPAVPGVRGEIKALPSYTGSTNPTCRNCGGTRNGNDRVGRRACRCDQPEFPNTTLPRMLAFQAWCALWAAECFRVLKPGGHLLAFGGTRTSHRLTCAVEDAGFEVRDSIMWIYGSGFPKSLDVSKAIDRRRDWAALPLLQGKIRAGREALGISQSEAARRIGLIGDGETLGGGGFMWFETGMRVPTGEQYTALKSALSLDDACDLAFEAAEREVLAETATNRNGGSWAENAGTGMFRAGERTVTTTAPATEDAKRWAGWGTALKPSHEPIVVARKPLSGSVAANVLAHGVGGLNVDGCRVGEGGQLRWAGPRDMGYHGGTDSGSVEAMQSSVGRWPSNVVLSHLPGCNGACADGCAVAELDRQSGTSHSAAGRQSYVRADTTGWRERGGSFTPGREWSAEGYGDSGGASRFFPVFRYEAKAPSVERPRVGNGPARGIFTNRCALCGRLDVSGSRCECPEPQWIPRTGEHEVTAHPTVKPLDLMRWLVRLVCPPGGLVLEPFAGSGTTAEACVIEGMRCVAVEREEAYLPLIVQRLAKPIQPVLL